MTSPLALLETCARHKLAYLKAGNPIGGGRNGPHNHPEPPLRNAAHWAITFSRLFKLTGDEEYLTGAKIAYSVLTQNPALQAGRVPILRELANDRANGVIGLAWVIESLVITAEVLQCSWGQETARRLATLPGFDWQVGFWKTCTPDGQIKEIDPTPNHQLWFAMALSMVSDKDPETNDRLCRFVELYPNYMALTPDQMIAHQASHTGVEKLEKAQKSIDLMRAPPVNALMRRIGWVHPRLDRLNKYYTYVTEKEVGYHIFNLHAIGRLKRYGITFDNLEERIDAAIETVHAPEYRNILENNKWGYPYNPPGFEVPIVLMTFATSDSRSVDAIRYYYDKQLELTYNSANTCFDRNNSDSNTLTARIYTLALLEPDELDRISRPAV
jgi:hypothetical protein